MRNYFEFQNGVKIKCGEGALGTIGAELTYYDVKKPLIITSSSAEKLGVTEKVKAAVAARGISDAICFLYDQTEIMEETAKQIKETYQSEGCDGIIAVGGDTVIDTAKIVRFFLSENCEEILPIIGTGKAKTKEIPTIAIPTENGSGKEANGYVEYKDSYLTSNALVPNVVIIDDKTAMTAPSRTVAALGAYTLTNAIEAYLNADEDSMVEIYAEKAIHLTAKYLLKFVQNSEDNNACRGMALAGTLAGIAYGETQFGAGHALALAISEATTEPIEEAYAIALLPTVEKAVKERAKRMKNLLLPIVGAKEYAETPDSERAQRTITEVKKLLESLHDKANVPIKISQTKIAREEFGNIAERAANKREAITAYKPVTKEDFIAMLNSAY